jgi:hypothetical protein
MKQGKMRVVAAFKDHLAIILRMASSEPIPIRGRGQWRMNTAVLRDNGFQRLLKQKWEEWRNHRKHCPTAVFWWERFVKSRLKSSFMWEGAERRRDRRALENFYYEVIYALLQTLTEHATKATKLKQLKANIALLPHVEQGSRYLNHDDRYRLDGERTTLCHTIRKWKRQESKAVQIVYDKEGVPQTSTVRILKTFRNHM